MIILDKPYVSPLLEETVLKNDYPVIKNEMVKSLESFEKMNVLDDLSAVKLLKEQKNIQLYTNSENSINWIANHLSFTKLPEQIELFKDKVKFRRLLSELYPDFYFQECNLSDLKNINPDNLKMPLVLKPAVGFLSMGVYIIQNKEEWNNIVCNIENDIEKFKNQFPKEVVDSSKFIIEELIDGDEFAVDAYFDENGLPVILNIFKHPFSGTDDVSDRVYFTSKNIILSFHDKFEKLLSEIGKLANLKNFPMHLEVRVNEEKIIPIEVNPMRFAGWCVTDLAYFAYGINIYEYYFSQKRPEWKKILQDKDDEYYYLTIAEVPVNLNKLHIEDVDYEGFLNNISKPVEVRKIDYKKHPIFAIVFAKTNESQEMFKILRKDMSDYIKIKVYK